MRVVWRDLLEFVVAVCKDGYINRAFSAECNEVLDEEMSAYRFVNGKFVQITGSEEISAIEEAQQLSDSLQTVREHLSQALHLLADRERIDLRGSISESLRSIDALATLLMGKPKCQSTEDLRELEGKLNLPIALRAAFEWLYGYSSGAGGRRHALLDEPNLTFYDAKFMLVSCSAFVSYALAKAAGHAAAR